METLGISLFFAGTGMLAIGWLWLIAAAFRTHWAWGLGMLFPPTAFVFIPLRWQAARKPAVAVLCGTLLLGAAFGCGWYEASLLRPHIKQVDGELHVTLTGWGQQDYGILRLYPQTVVLQMANADVTDATLARLAGMSQLRELDVNDSQVTDAGLAALAVLPALETLRLANTRVTDAGFREHLLPREKLRELDLRGTGVAAETVREWRKAKAGRRALR